MPWNGRTVTQMRKEFVEEVLAQRKTKSQLCLEYGISRPTGDKWIQRYLSDLSLEDQSRRPHSSPGKTSPEIEKLILDYRKDHPAIGAIKIHRILQNKGYTNLPSPRTVNNILNRNGMISLEASLASMPMQRFQKERPNEMWQADYKGHFALKNGKRCHPLNIIDDCSRFNLCCKAQNGETFEEIQPVMIALFEEFGMPEIFLCDNGNPWGTQQSTGFTRFEVWLMELGILTIHGRVRHPQTQGKEESFNRSMTKELLKLHEFADFQEAQRFFDEYRTFYNTERPHHSLNLDTPEQHYSKSEKAYPGTVREWEYEQSGSLRRIKETGFLTWGGQGYFLSEAFGGKEIMVCEEDNRRVINLYFRQFHIGRIDLEKRVFTFKKAYLSANDPRQNRP